MMRTERRVEKPTRKLLLALLAGAAIIVALSSPHGTRRLLRAVGYEIRARRERERLRWTIAYLRRKRYINYQKNPDGTTNIVLSENGHRKALRYKLETMALPRPRRWDGKWRLVAFDIPEEKKRARDALSAKLRELGFVQLQKSLWAWPYECLEETDFVSEMFGVGPYVHYVVAESITSEKFLRYKFHFA